MGQAVATRSSHWASSALRGGERLDVRQRRPQRHRARRRPAAAVLVAAVLVRQRRVAPLRRQADQRQGGAATRELDLDDLDRMHRTNIRGTFVVNQQAARRVRAGGAIVNFSTSVVRVSLPTYAAYAASKAAVEAVSLILARELRGRDITVNAVAPGPTATALFLDGKDEAAVRRMAGMDPMERLGRPGDIAEVVSFLAGPGRWSTARPST